MMDAAINDDNLSGDSSFTFIKIIRTHRIWFLVNLKIIAPKPASWEELK